MCICTYIYVHIYTINVYVYTCMYTHTWVETSAGISSSLVSNFSYAMRVFLL